MCIYDSSSKVYMHTYTHKFICFLISHIYLLLFFRRCFRCSTLWFSACCGGSDIRILLEFEEKFAYRQSIVMLGNGRRAALRYALPGIKV